MKGRKKRQRQDTEWWKGKNYLYLCQKKNGLMDGENKGAMEGKEEIKEENERERGIMLVFVEMVRRVRSRGIGNGMNEGCVRNGG